jgi:segregation and condensation protein A
VAVVTAATPGRGPQTLETGAFVVELDQFSGPLDLLLHLIREDELDITDLPIARIADQFLAVIHDLGLDRASDYLEMAARLLRIKAQMLLPRRIGEDEWEDPRAELVRRLLEYQQIRELVGWLQAAAAGRAERFGRGFEAPAPDLPPAPLEIQLNDLLAAAERVVSLIPEPMLHRVVPRPLDVEAPRGGSRPCSRSARSSAGGTCSTPAPGSWRSCPHSSRCSSWRSAARCRSASPPPSPPW